MSIIIPHYNSIEGIERLIKSIPICNWIEIIIVDDRSTCNIEELKNFEKSRSGQVSLFYNDHLKKGAGTARNIGVENAKGKWLIFADADDYFLDGWTENIKKNLDSDAEIVYFPPTSYNVSTQNVGARHRHYEELVLSYVHKQNNRAESELRYGFYTPWSKMIKRELFENNNIRFDEQMVANDVMAITMCAYYASKIIASENAIYCVTCGEKTLTSKKTVENFDMRIDTKIRRYTFLRKNLSKKTFRYTHMDYYMAGSLADAVLGKWGWKKVWEILCKYRANKVHYITIYMFEPSFLLHYILLDFKWRMETNGK